MTRRVWRHGISREAAEFRGDLWWGNASTYGPRRLNGLNRRPSLHDCSSAYESSEEDARSEGASLHPDVVDKVRDPGSGAKHDDDGAKMSPEQDKKRGKASRRDSVRLSDTDRRRGKSKMYSSFVEDDEDSDG